MKNKDEKRVKGLKRGKIVENYVLRTGKEAKLRGDSSEGRII